MKFSDPWLNRRLRLRTEIRTIGVDFPRGTGLLAGGDEVSLAVSFAGTTFVNLSATTLPLNSPYAEYSATIAATSSSSPLIVSYVDQPSYVLIDDVSVTAPASAVPEPAEAALLLAGLAFMGSAAARAR